MKTTRRIATLLLALVMILSLATVAFAKEVTYTGEDAGSGTITIPNAAKGETYRIYKLFSATVANGSIAYTGEIPIALADYFEKDSAGNISAKDAAKNGDAMSEGLKTALKIWTESATVTASADSDGTALTFKDLPYGYYVVTTSQGDQLISVDSTNPTATIYDKNSTVPTASKTTQDDNVSIGDSVTYTLTFNTANYLGDDANAKQIVKYVIADTLPEFLSNVTVTKITIGNEEYKVNGEYPQFNSATKSITIPWANNGTSLYENGADIVITYTATVNDKITIGGQETNVNANTVTLTPYTDENTPWSETYESSESIYTYAAGLKKTDGTNALAGATFAAKGLIVEGSAGSYTVVSYVPTSDTNGTVMECDANGKLVIYGLASDVQLVVTEVKAPAGYNKLTTTTTLTPTLTSTTTTVTKTTTYYDENGEVTNTVTDTSTTTVTSSATLTLTEVEVVNNAGSLLPSTGGIGTTIFYIVGGLLVAGAVILLVTKKRMSAEQ